MCVFNFENYLGESLCMLIISHLIPNFALPTNQLLEKKNRVLWIGHLNDVWEFRYAVTRYMGLRMKIGYI